MKLEPTAIRGWERADFARLAAVPGLSKRTLRLRFWGAVPAVPESYLRRSGRSRFPSDWDAVAAVDVDELVGWAEYGRHPDDPTIADVAVCVVDAAQGQGLGRALIAALVERARGAGLARVHADIAPHNEAARRAWRYATGSAAADLVLAG